MQEAARLLEVEGRGSRLASLQKQLVARRCRLACAYGAVYFVGPKPGLPLLSLSLKALQCLVIWSSCLVLLPPLLVPMKCCHPVFVCCRSAWCVWRVLTAEHSVRLSEHAVSEPEPPPGGFPWDFMDMLWFTGVLSWHSTRSTAWASMSHKMHVVPVHPMQEWCYLDCKRMPGHLHLYLPNRCCWWVSG